MYRIPNRFRSDVMTPEESQVFEALKHYRFDPEDTAISDFCPTDVLYQVYLTYARKFNYADDGEDLPEILDATKFGIALRRAFDVDRYRRARCRNAEGKLIWGYRHVRGPGSFTMRDVGRPRCTSSFHNTAKIAG